MTNDWKTIMMIGSVMKSDQIKSNQIRNLFIAKFKDSKYKTDNRLCKTRL